MGGACGVYSNEITVELTGDSSKDEVVAEVPAKSLADDGPVCERPYEEFPAYLKDVQKLDQNDIYAALQ